jgi:probable selenium-dependent hydroxylase accessory protein YqeC
MMAKKETLLGQFGINSEVRVIAIVGAGGKTSLMYALAREFLAQNETVISTTSAKIAPPTPDQSPKLLLFEEDPDLKELPEQLRRFRHVTVGRAIMAPHGKLDGIPENTIARLLDTADKVIVEADGAAGRPIKAPEDWEPVIPSFANLVIPVVGLDCVGKPASEDWVFRLDKFLALTGLRRGDIINPESVAKLLSGDDGALKETGADATVIPFLNKLDLLVDKAAVAAIIRNVTELTDRIQQIVVGKLRDKIELRSFVIGRDPFHGEFG